MKIETTLLNGNPKRPEDPTGDALANIDYFARQNEEEGGSYLKGFGISLETQKRFKIGYCKDWSNPKTSKQKEAEGEKVYRSPVVIFPLEKGFYNARKIKATDKRFRFENVGNKEPFNFFGAIDEARKDGTPIFVTEGEKDALSFEENGFHAIGLSGTGEVNHFLEKLSKVLTPPFPSFVASLDWDNAGRKASKKLVEGLREMGLLAVEADLNGYCFEFLESFGETLPEEQRKKDLVEYLEDKETAKRFEAFLKANTKATFPKDPNEIWKLTPENFLVWASESVEKAEREKTREADEYKRDFLTAFENFVSFKDKSLLTRPIPTGYPSLDKLLGGGLENRLYTLGATSSLGKSTFILQMACNIARAGNDVLFFALEMSSSELISKSLSRLTCQMAIQGRESVGYSRTANEVIRRENWGSYPKRSKELLSGAIEAYRKEIAPRLFIFEGLGEVGFPEIAGAVERHKRATGKNPVVFVDYLQILKIQESQKGMLDKQIIDENVLSLKRLSNVANVPVFCVSAFNRDNYEDETGQASFKGSSAIEYGSDVLLGLQLSLVSEEAFLKETNKSKKRLLIHEALTKKVGNGIALRNLSLKVLKNRSGERGDFKLNYLPAFNFLYEPGNVVNVTDVSERKPGAFSPEDPTGEESLPF